MNTDRPGGAAVASSVTVPHRVGPVESWWGLAVEGVGLGLGCAGGVVGAGAGGCRRGAAAPAGEIRGKGTHGAHRRPLCGRARLQYGVVSAAEPGRGTAGARTPDPV